MKVKDISVQLPNLIFDLSESRNDSRNDDWNRGDLLLNDFVVENILGEGGMGKVYLVRSRCTGRKFALKKAKGLNSETRKNFMSELQTWIDLPDHPNLVPCRFFRTLNSEILIFAEYVEGGSLRDWIDSKRLYEGGPRNALERILDVSIQSAWGLHCVHEQGIVHQDVKPGNVLMDFDTEHGVRPRITDYGLAKAKVTNVKNTTKDSHHSILVSNGGGTPAYWSPEQSQGLPLTRKADIWSWALSVFEMFSGEVTWLSGVSAANVIEQYLEENKDYNVFPLMPDNLAHLLRQCFHPNPFERPSNLSEVIDKMLEIYLVNISTKHSLSSDSITPLSAPYNGVKNYQSTTGSKWSDSKLWLERALRVAGRNPNEATKMLERRANSRRGEVVAELIGYDEAKRLYEDLIFGGRIELRSDLSSLCMEKALIHSTCADEYGSLHEYDQAILIREELINQDNGYDLSNLLAESYMNKANTLISMGNNDSAVRFYDKAIKILNQLTEKENNYKVSNNLALCYTNKAIVISNHGDKSVAVKLFNQAITIREQLVNNDGHGDLAAGLASTYLNKADLIYSLGDSHGAVELQGKAIDILGKLVHQNGHVKLSEKLAVACINKSVTVRNLGDIKASLDLCNQAIAILDRLINNNRQIELSNDMALALLNKANCLVDLNNCVEANEIYDTAITIWKRMVNDEGRNDLKHYLDLAIASNQKIHSCLESTPNSNIDAGQFLNKIELRDDEGNFWGVVDFHKVESFELTKAGKERFYQAFLLPSVLAARKNLSKEGMDMFSRLVGLPEGKWTETHYCKFAFGFANWMSDPSGDDFGNLALKNMKEAVGGFAVLSTVPSDDKDISKIYKSCLVNLK